VLQHLEFIVSVLDGQLFDVFTPNAPVVPHDGVGTVYAAPSNALIAGEIKSAERILHV
jgi:hypothetical protein